MKLAIVLLSILFTVMSARAAEPTPDPWAGNLVMNGYGLKDYANFQKDWTLVTVRYRQDSGEYRFVYANPLAWKAMQEGKTYPDGAVFAKTAYLLGSDPMFPSSLTPGKVNRYQLMVKNAEKHKETGGWGYALFDSTGRTYPGEPHAATLACYACHQIVREKQFVFAEPFSKEISFFSDVKAKSVMKKENRYLPKFETLIAAKLPSDLQKNLPKGAKSVRSIVGDLKKYLFEGTLNEIRPFLATEAISANVPAALLSEDGTQFSLVYKDANANATCNSPSGKSSPMVAIVTTKDAGRSSAPYADPGTREGGIATSSFCFIQTK